MLLRALGSNVVEWPEMCVFGEGSKYGCISILGRDHFCLRVKSGKQGSVDCIERGQMAGFLLGEQIALTREPAPGAQLPGLWPPLG